MKNKPLSRIFPYKIRKSTRAKRIGISINAVGEITLVVPEERSQKKAEKFLHEKRGWIQKTRNKILEKNKKPQEEALKNSQNTTSNIFSLTNFRSEKKTELDYQEHKEAAREFVQSRIKILNSDNFFRFKKVFIKNQKTRWGSCSSLKNLNFNYKIVFLPQNLADYLIIHELCHLHQMNHSPKFWKLVENFIPNYRALRKQLR